MSLKDKIIYNMAYNDSFGFQDPANDKDCDGFTYEDVKEAILKEEDLITELIKGKLNFQDFIIKRREIFGYWEK